MAIINRTAIISNEDTESCLRKILREEGYELTPLRACGEMGVDIVAKRGRKSFYIEVIGYKSSGPARARDFFQAFFRAVSRIKDGAKNCAIAMPSRAKRGLNQRARQYGESWTRIGEAFPELEIWLVDVENRTYERSTWNYWLK